LWYIEGGGIVCTCLMPPCIHFDQCAGSPVTIRFTPPVRRAINYLSGGCRCFDA
jgi:hypothetical protein